MKSVLYRKIGIYFPLFGVSHCRNVVTEISKAGGFGVLGAVRHTHSRGLKDRTVMDQ